MAKTVTATARKLAILFYLASTGPNDPSLARATLSRQDPSEGSSHVDAAVVLRRTTDGILVEALVTEMLRQPDDEKYWSWPIHVAGTRARLRCPTTLVVITGDERTARWVARPIDLGRGQAVLQISPPFSKWAREHFFEGVARGEEKGREGGLRRAIVLVLESRGLVPSGVQREQLARCTDGAQLEAWLRHAGVAAAGDPLFDSPA